ncbi:Y4yA family PLP-dependent enzyme [Streptomyces sp. NPDC127051]|uniref:Y4yA family PLP-dependent enzyme n=1 Tax=Streptomyces sp. NPDC127051 TaxID=3347119 RepID=UPI003653D6E8
MELTGVSLPEAPPPSLPSIEPEWAQQLRSDPRLLVDIAEAVRGPFHVLFPARFRDNVMAFNEAMAAAGVEGQVCYGKKANRSGCWLSACVESNAGVDVASAPELVHSLACGVRGEDLVVTGAAKSGELLWLAARHRCLIAVDALDELERVIALAHTAGPVRLLLRILPEINSYSRFGFNSAELGRALQRCVQVRGQVFMEGFSFHLNGYEVAPRAALAAELVGRCVAARAQGLVASSISIGGGFAVSYLEAETWQRFNQDYRDSWFHNNKTFNQFYPYHQSPTGADMLAEILSSPAAGAYHDVGEAFIETGTRLILEPGRALLDKSGLTVFPVQGFKKRGDYGIVTVAGLSASLSEQWKGSEYLPDPMLWPSVGVGDPVNACVGGSSCLEYDMLSWRKVPFPRPPSCGDLLVYPNTAGYQMDKNETRFHQLPLPARIVVALDEGRFRWWLD